MVLTSLNACKIKVKKLMTTKEKIAKESKIKTKQNKQNNKYKSTKIL